MSSKILPDILGKKNIYKLVYDFNSNSQSKERDDNDVQTAQSGIRHKKLPKASSSSASNLQQPHLLGSSNPNSSLRVPGGSSSSIGHRIHSGSSLNTLEKRTLSRELSALSIAAASTAVIQNRMKAARTAAALPPPPVALETNNQEPSNRQRLAFYLDTSHTGRFLELGDATLSLLQCLLYIFNTMYVAPPAPEKLDLTFERKPNSIPLPQTNRYLELGIAFMMFAMFTFRLYIAPQRGFFLTTGYAILTLVSGAPVIMAHILSCWDTEVWLSYMSAGVRHFCFQTFSLTTFLVSGVCVSIPLGTTPRSDFCCADPCS